MSELLPAVRSSVEEMETSLGEPLKGYALCTDTDLLTIYPAGYSRKEMTNFKDDVQKYNPAEWVEQNPSPLNSFSGKLNQLVRSFYSQESANVNPGDDHLRLWKKQIYFDLINELAKSRDLGILPKDKLLLLIAHDCSDDFLSWMIEGSKALNQPEQFSGWRSFIKCWYGE